MVTSTASEIIFHQQQMKEIERESEIIGSELQVKIKSS